MDDEGKDLEAPGDHSETAQDLSGARDVASDGRDRASESRDRASEDRDRRSEARDHAAEDRDRSAESRDRSADEGERSALHRVGPERRDSRTRRRSTDVDAASDRASAASDRENAASDREAALGSRQDGADDRARASDDREASSEDRGVSAHDREVSITDELTGAHLRGAGLAELEREIARAKRTEKPFVLAFVDVDGLKATNDSLGHASGDRLLRRVVDALRARFRGYDLIVRFGGDEFVCALLDLDLAKASERFLLIDADLAPHQASITVGLAQLEQDDSRDGLIARADVALYEERSRHPSPRARG